MAEEKKETWLNYLALTTVILAVCATLSTFKGGGYSTRSMMSQAQASDQWAFFQAKSIKSYLYLMQKENLELKLQEFPKGTAKEKVNNYQEKIADYKKKVEKYEQEKSEIQEKAKQLESVRDEAQKHSQAFGMAIIFLQISILLSSIAALLKKKLVWYAGLVTGAVGLFYFVNGFLLFV
jgi:DNA-binding transcriptional regulator of glucitol operon